MVCVCTDEGRGLARLTLQYESTVSKVATTGARGVRPSSSNGLINALASSEVCAQVHTHNNLLTICGTELGHAEIVITLGLMNQFIIK